MTDAWTDPINAPVRPCSGGSFEELSHVFRPVLLADLWTTLMRTHEPYQPLL